MPIELPEPDPLPIDRSRAGILSISRELLGELLRLPAGLEVVMPRVRADVVELLIEGGSMPPRTGADQAREPWVARRITVICHQEQRADGRRKITAWFSHAPEERWTLREWS